MDGWKFIFQAQKMLYTQCLFIKIGHWVYQLLYREKNLKFMSFLASMHI